MASQPDSPIHSAHEHVTTPWHRDVGLRLRAFLTTVMGLLTVVVFGLGCDRKSAFWLWIGFICALVTGIFVQVFINRQKRRFERHRTL
jgi:hypothetical protein